MLVRWQHPAYGQLPPNLFIPLAEKTGVIRDLTGHLIIKALQYCRDWSKSRRDLQISVNVSGNDLADPDIVAIIMDNIGNIGPRLILEVTETAIMRDIHACLANIDRLRNKGVQISLDDFGTGFSSLTYLKKLSPEELKVDQSFVKDILLSNDDRAIVRASIDLSHELGAKVTAEGVEDDAIRNKLITMHCDIAQGYGIARPCPILHS
jgi:EAL domain-containing protein (putative c-di-GMP-specific phosphodiesterase class I)